MLSFSEAIVLSSRLKIGLESGGSPRLMVCEYEGYPGENGSESATTSRREAVDMVTCDKGPSASQRSSLKSCRDRPKGVSSTFCAGFEHLFPNGIAIGIVVTGVFGVVAPLDLPENHPGESVSANEANDERRSELISNDEKLSDNDGQSRGEDNGENLHSVSSGGSSKARVAISSVGTDR